MDHERRWDRRQALIPASALAGSQHDLSAVRWSPDGTMVAFSCGSRTNPDVSHVCVMNADGTDIRHLTNESDAWFETDLVWSPDSTRIAFNRWYTDPATAIATIRPIGLASITGGTVTDAGPTPGRRWRRLQLVARRDDPAVDPRPVASLADGSGRSSTARDRRRDWEIPRGGVGRWPGKPPGNASPSRPRRRRPPFAGQERTPGGRARGSRCMRLGCGERIRTSDLRVMSPTSCRCSTPRPVTLGPKHRFGQTLCTSI